AFTPPKRPVDLRDWSQWWTFMKGAGWRRPYGPESNIKGLDDHPVVYVAYSDALAYATWAAKNLPAEAEREFAARAALGRRICLRAMANTWQGEFPIQKNSPPGLEHTSPVRA